jgi:hypothetical protein
MNRRQAEEKGTSVASTIASGSDAGGMRRAGELVARPAPVSECSATAGTGAHAGTGPGSNAHGLRRRPRQVLPEPA